MGGGGSQAADTRRCPAARTAHVQIARGSRRAQQVAGTLRLPTAGATYLEDRPWSGDCAHKPFYTGMDTSEQLTSHDSHLMNDHHGPRGTDSHKSVSTSAEYRTSLYG